MSIDDRDINLIPDPVPAVVPPREWLPSHSQRVLTSIDTSTDAGKVLLAQTLGPPDHDAYLCDGLEFWVEHVTAQRATEIDEKTGEEVQVCRVTMTDQNGGTLGGRSEYWRRAAQALVDAFGQPPYDPPIWIQVQRRPSKRNPGQTWLTFRVLGR